MIKKLGFSLVAGLALSVSAQAQTLVDLWTMNGGGLNPATYGGNFRPNPILPDATSNNGASITWTGLVVTPFGSGGLGSTNAGAYGGIYTFMAPSPTFTMQTSTVLDGVETITISFLAGGGDAGGLDYDASTLVLNYNLANPTLAASGFNAVSGIIVDSPIGEQNLTLYTWTWDVSSLEESTGFSTTWNTQGNEHVFYTDMSLTQAVPEPSAICLIAVGGAAVLLRRKRRN